MRKFSLHAPVLTLMLSLIGCSGIFPSDQIDPSGDLTRDDYIALRYRGQIDKDEPILRPHPSSKAPYKIAAKPKEKPAPKEKRISLSVTDTTPLRDVLIELGREGKVNMEIDPRISGGVIFSASDQPFSVVLRRICALAGLRYHRAESFVRIELDDPYQKTYALDYLSLARKTNSVVAIATNVFDVDINNKNSGSSESGAGKNNSTAQISSTAEADFWSEIKKSLPHVLATSGKKPFGSNGKEKAIKSNFSIDRQAGLVTVFGNEQQHKAVSHYIGRLEKKTSAQVLIEARIIEIELNEAFESGVNWSSLVKDSSAVAAQFGSTGASGLISGATSGVFTATFDTKDISGILNLVRTFGTTRVLSSPRLTVMNNQTAVLKVARNEVYFLTSAQFPTTVTTTGSTVSGTPVFSSTPHTVPVGLVMTVQPSINSRTNRITMTLRPTISRVVSYVSDPSIALNAANADVTNIESKVPVLAVREMDSVLQLQSGEVAILGGLMQDSSENQDQGVPPFDTLPFIGNLTKSRSNDGTTSELVILLRATILENPQPDQADRELYQRYNSDPRPILSPQT